MDLIQLTSVPQLKKAAELAELCFHENKENYLINLKEKDLRGIFEGEQLIAALGSINLEMFIREQLFPCAGIFCVMTHPIYRKRGIIKNALSQLLQEKYKEGYLISTLWPFTHSFYQKFGYENCERVITYKFAPSDLRKDIPFDAEISIKEATENDYPLLYKAALNASNKYTRLIGKTAAWQIRNSLTQRKLYLFLRGKEPVGYISFKFEKKGPWDFHLNVLDLVYTNLSAKKSILHFLANFSADISTIVLALPYEEEFLSYLSEPKEEHGHNFADWPAMSRVLNVSKYLEHFDFPNIDEKLYLKINDPIIQENNGYWLIEISGGKAKVSQTDEPEQSSILKLSIGQFTQLTMGCISLEALAETASIFIPREWRRVNLFPTKPCAIQLEF